jgi:hypothetical protein
MELVSTSHIERLNATTRLHVKRLSRLTLAFSKKFENFQAAVALHFAYYNFVRRHNTLRCTPAMEQGLSEIFGAWAIWLRRSRELSGRIARRDSAAAWR